jgi:hypothetical protein
MKNIAEALVEFQSQLKPIEKDAENPFFKSDYLTLAGILKNVLPVLTNCGLSVIQPMRVEGDKTILQTKLTHTSGEFVLSEMIMPTIVDAQKFGSLITYYKRYQLQAMLGISSVSDDDDAELVVKDERIINSSSLDPREKQSNYVSGKPTEQQSKAIWSICNRLKIPDPKLSTFEEAKNWITEKNKSR